MAETLVQDTIGHKEMARLATSCGGQGNQEMQVKALWKPNTLLWIVLVPQEKSLSERWFPQLKIMWMILSYSLYLRALLQRGNVQHIYQTVNLFWHWWWDYGCLLFCS